MTKTAQRRFFTSRRILERRALLRRHPRQHRRELAAHRKPVLALRPLPSVNPTDTGSGTYNPLLEVWRSSHNVRDVQSIADILVDPEGALERRATAGRAHPIWLTVSKPLFDCFYQA